MGEKGGAVVGIGDDVMGEGMQCIDHPYRGNPAGGICALCLQEKLGKLVSSPAGFFPLPPPTSSSSSPSSSGLGGGPSLAGAGGGRDVGRGRTKITFLSATASHQKKKKSRGGMASSTTTTTTTSSSSSSSATTNSGILALKRSKSVAPRPLGGLAEGGSRLRYAATTDSPRKKSFWSFFYHYSGASAAASAATTKRRSSSSSSSGGKRDAKQQQGVGKEEEGGSRQDEDEVVESPQQQQSSSSSSFGRKVARSRSVGCGSRSFSGDFLERISFGDCSTLRRVESQREAKAVHHHHHDGDEEQRIKERVKCGGLFGGFGMISSSSSTTYWLSAADDFVDNAGRISTSVSGAARGGSRSRSWAWASFASPMRAFRPANPSKPYAITSGGGAGGSKIINGSSSSLPVVGLSGSQQQ